MAHSWHIRFMYRRTPSLCLQASSKPCSETVFVEEKHRLHPLPSSAGGGPGAAGGGVGGLHAVPGPAAGVLRPPPELFHQPHQVRRRRREGLRDPRADARRPRGRRRRPSRRLSDQLPARQWCYGLFIYFLHYTHPALTDSKQNHVHSLRESTPIPPPLVFLVLRCV